MALNIHNPNHNFGYDFVEYIIDSIHKEITISQQGDLKDFKKSNIRIDLEPHPSLSLDAWLRCPVANPLPGNGLRPTIVDTIRLARR